MTGLNTLFLSFSAMQIVVFVALAIYYFKVSAPVSGTTEWINMAEKKRENISSQPATISLKNVLLAFAFAIVAGIGKYLILSVGKTGGALSLDGSLAAINGASLSAPVFGILSGLIFICISLFCHNTFAASVATGAFILIYSLSFPGPGLAIRIMGEITKEKADTLRLADAIYREELEKAGLSRIIEENQRQLNEWMANQ